MLLRDADLEGDSFLDTYADLAPNLDSMCYTSAVPPRHRHASCDTSRTQARHPNTIRYTFAIRAPNPNAICYTSPSPAFNPHAICRTLAIPAPNPKGIWGTFLFSEGQNHMFLWDADQKNDAFLDSLQTKALGRMVFAEH